jgi:hypothetical protein
VTSAEPLRQDAYLRHHAPVELETKRWTRYGKDRIYVSAPDGARVGWLDLLTQEQHLEQPALSGEFMIALQRYLTTQSPAPVREAVTEAPVPLQRPAEDEGADLALHRPGQLVRAEAQEQLAGMKERSKVGTFLARAFDMKTDERAFRVGASGEETVGARLEKLEKHGWHVLHSIPVGKGDSDIDHLLIGPGGVFTVNTKNHPGKQVWVGQHAIRINGHSTRYLPIARHEADRAQKLLTQAVGWDVPVKAVLVILTGTVIPQVTIKQMPQDVLVLDRMDIPRIFKRGRQHLTAEQVERVFGQARWSRVWRGGSFQ